MKKLSLGQKFGAVVLAYILLGAFARTASKIGSSFLDGPLAVLAAVIIFVTLVVTFVKAIPEFAVVFRWATWKMTGWDCDRPDEPLSQHTVRKPMVDRYFKVGATTPQGQKFTVEACCERDAITKLHPLLGRRVNVMLDQPHELPRTCKKHEYR